MRVSKKLLGMLIVLALGPTSFEVAGADVKVGVVSVPRLLDEAPQAKAAMQELQEEFAPRQREIVVQQEELTAMEEKLRRDTDVMSDTERRNQDKKIRETKRNLQRRQTEYLEDLNLRRNEELGRLNRVLLQKVQSFAEEMKYDLIVGDGVLFASGSMDVTGEILERLQLEPERLPPKQ